MPEKTEKKKAAPTPETKKGAVIYLGPEIPGAVSAGTVFSRGLPPKLEAVLKELPAAGKLLVPVGDAVKIRKELKNETSAASICYRKTAEYAAQKGERK